MLSLQRSATVVAAGAQQFARAQYSRILPILSPSSSASRRRTRTRTCGVPIRASSSLPPSQQQRQQPPTTATLPTTATACVEAGLAVFETKSDYQGALALFQRALTLNPNEDEARAALYNAACALTKLKRWQEAADAVVAAVNDHNLKLAVALRDPDLVLLRERREWNEALSKAAGGITNQTYVKLRAEAKSPFRFSRIFLFGALAAGAGIGLFIITGRLVAALRGGQGAPELQETAQNFAINLAALSALLFLLYRDFTGERKDLDIIEREEQLASLQVTLGPGRQVPLAAFRGTTRPVIVTGSKGQVAKALATAEPFREDMRARGVSIVPVVLRDAQDPGERLRRLKEELNLDSESSSTTSSTTSSSSSSTTPTLTSSGAVVEKKGFSSSTSNLSRTESSRGGVDAETGQVVLKKDDRRRWQLEAAGLEEWAQWVRQQAKAAGVTSPGDHFYVQVQLDGSVRASGGGNPPWRQFIDDIPPLDDVRTALSDGKGMVGSGAGAGSGFSSRGGGGRGG